MFLLWSNADDTADTNRLSWFGSRNPQKLYLPDSSIYWGPNYLSWLYYSKTNANCDFATRLQAAIGKYNGGPGVYPPDVQSYIDAVVSFIDDYQPQ